MNSPVEHRAFVPTTDPAASLRGTEVGDAVREHARRTPDRPALLHKRHGRWFSLSWAYVGQEVARLDAVLSAQLAAQGARDLRVVVSGAYDPDLVILALATLAAGGKVYALDPALAGADLARALAVIAPTQALVQGRRAIGAWLESPTHARAPVPLFVTRPFIQGNERWTIVPLRDPAETVAPGAVRGGRGPAAGVVWVDETTQWTGGLASLLDAVLDDGRTVAFPETGASALRDRRELQPASLLASAARRGRLVEEDRARRGAQGGLLRRLTDWAERSPAFLAHLINRRRLAVLGLAGLDTAPLAVPAPSVALAARPADAAA